MKKSNLKKLICLAFVLLFALTAVLPLSAAAVEADQISITINKNDKLPAMTEGQFQAYQVFQGEVKSDNVMTNIQWGSGVNGSAIIAALQAKVEEPDVKFQEVFGHIKVWNAATVAAALDGQTNDSQFMLDFADVVAEHLTGVYTSSQLDAAGNSVINLEQGGYYFVKDTKVPAEDEKKAAVSEYILKVVGKVNVAVKADIPTVDKSIVGSDGKDLNGDAAGVSDYVQFKLTGKLAQNFDEYTTYFYAFHDTLSEGLTFVDTAAPDYTDHSLVVKIGDQEVSSELYQVQFDGQNLTVTFADLKDQALNEFNITKDSVITVTYYAKVNENALIGQSSNTNQVYLEYSNNPNSEGKGNTEVDITYVYAFELDINKIGADTTAALSGAEFRLSKQEGAKTLYAQVAGDGTLTGWTETADEASTLTTNEDGKLTVKGLDEGTYTLTETKAPEGYVEMDPIVFKIVPTINEAGELTGLIAEILDQEGGDPSSRTDVEKGQIEVSKGQIPMTLTNQKQVTLPSTGGIGTVIFYVVGGVLIFAALAYMILSGTKKKNKAEN